ncbi:MAG TPA: hypothetical protein VF998_01045 [Candidatus Limnocylindria bacterium]
MASVPAELLFTIVALVLVAVATGTLTARLFVAASRPRPHGGGTRKDG